MERTAVIHSVKARGLSEIVGRSGMSADVVNLRKARKAKARAQKDAQAEQNRLIFGRTKAERRLAQSVRRLHDNLLDQKMISNPTGPTALTDE
jgi:hypothetical protein